MNQRPRQPSRLERSPVAAELPPPVQRACRALGLEVPPLAYRPDDSGGWTIIAADGRKFYWQPEQTP
ncbi:MAG: hypothetical protein KatS3mg051_1867 [Anaerolineae bacterium]|nr:MAG: hypothetical protein KatS3mg051_1867 [Anaerolineae bacterium]